ncbi:STAS domain-containing protein, partial [Planctomycetota bacterium]
MPQLKVQVRRSTIGDDLPVVWVALDGFLDASTVLSFESTLELLHSDEQGELILDLGKVLYANSSAIGTILNYRNLLLEKGRELVLVNVNPDVRRTFELLGLSAIVPCLADEATALKYFLSAPAGHRDPERFALGAPQGAADGQPVPEEAPLQSVEPSECKVMMIVPEENRFTDIMRLRLKTPHGTFRIVSDCTEALHVFDDMNPDLVVLEDPLAGSDDFVWTLKTERGKSIIPIVKLYWTGTDIEARKEFKIWEDDFLVEPFELMELFVLSERELRRMPEDRKVLLHQTHFEFRTREGNLRKANELAATFFQKAGLSGEATAQLAAGFAEAIENAARHAHHYAARRGASGRLNPLTCRGSGGGVRR